MRQLNSHNYTIDGGIWDRTCGCYTGDFVHAHADGRFYMYVCKMSKTSKSVLNVCTISKTSKFIGYYVVLYVVSSSCFGGISRDAVRSFYQRRWISWGFPLNLGLFFVFLGHYNSNEFSAKMFETGNQCATMPPIGASIKYVTLFLTNFYPPP